MNPGNVRLLKAFLITSLIVSQRIPVCILKNISQMNFVQQFSSEKCALSELTSPSSLDIMGFIITAASDEVSMKDNTAKSSWVLQTQLLRNIPGHGEDSQAKRQGMPSNVASCH